MLDGRAGIADCVRLEDPGVDRPDPEVPERAKWRTFTAKYKLAVLAGYGSAADDEKGAVLRPPVLDVNKANPRIRPWPRCRE